MFAPIVLFVYNRVDHTQKIIESIGRCPEALESELYIFSDGPKNEQAASKVKEVRAYIHNEKIQASFKNVNIIEAPKNKGLANSVISGVTRVMNQYGRAIVVEDDNIAAPGFLRFMNAALDFYEHNPRIWSIGGYTPKITIPSDYKHDVFIMDKGSSYAWATWKDRWDSIDWEIRDYPSFKRNFRLRRAFNRVGNDRCDMLQAQMEGRIDSWAIRFTYNAFRQNKMFVLPAKSLISNTGNDGSGVHVGNGDTRFDVDIEDCMQELKLEDVEFDRRIQKEIAKLMHVSFLRHLKMKVKRLLR